MRTHEQNMKALTEFGAGAERRYCWYVPGSPLIVDAVKIDKYGHPVGCCSGEPWDGIKARYPGVELWLFDDALLAIREFGDD